MLSCDDILGSMYKLCSWFVSPHNTFSLHIICFDVHDLARIGSRIVVVQNTPQSRAVPCTPVTEQVAIGEDDCRLRLDLMLVHVSDDTLDIGAATTFDLGRLDQRI